MSNKQLTRTEIIELRARAIHNQQRKNGATAYTFEEVCNNIGLESTQAYRIALAVIEADEKAGVLTLVEENSTDYECENCGKLNYKSHGLECQECGKSWQRANTPVYQCAKEQNQ